MSLLTVCNGIKRCDLLDRDFASLSTLLSCSLIAVQSLIALRGYSQVLW